MENKNGLNTNKIYSDTKPFVHLHCHSEFSILDGNCQIIKLMKKLKKLNMDTVAITDHNHTGGWYNFLNACKENNIKPILGCEMYQTWDTKILSLDAKLRKKLAKEKAIADGIEFPKKLKAKEENKLLEPYEYDTRQYHLIVLAINQVGMNNLIKLQSEASRVCTFNGRFCCDFELLEKYNEGLIVLSACIGGIIPKMIESNNIEKAYELARKFKSIFGDRFYLEIQPLAIDLQKKVNLELVKMGKELDIELVATNDCHYINEEDSEDHDTLICIGTKKLKSDTNRMHYAKEYWVRSRDEMIEAFNRHENLDKDVVLRALNNTKVIADRIKTYKLGADKPLFPKVNVPKGYTAESYLIAITYKKLYQYKKANPKIDLILYEKRIYHELNVINSKGFAPYFLKIFENIEFCKANDIPVGPGRGSASGSETLFLNGGTKVTDPIEYDLLFFRFLTQDRVDPPDIDMDFSYSKRPLLIKHLEEQHGKDAVCHIGTWGELKIKGAVKDFGKVLGYSFNEMNELTSELDDIMDNANDYSFEDFDNLLRDANDFEKVDKEVFKTLMKKYNRFKFLEDKYSEIFRLARKFNGLPRQMGVHASGILVMPCPVTDYFPTRYDANSGDTIALFTGPQLEDLKAIKLDILGLKTLDVLDKCLKAIDPKLTVDDLYDKISEFFTDSKMYEELNKKRTEGVFQVESKLFKSLITDIMPDNERDICAILAIGRPGPLSSNMHKRYALRKKGIEEATVQLRDTEDITGDTFNTIIYQEQCMLIAKKVAGFDDSQADSILRKALA